MKTFKVYHLLTKKEVEKGDLIFHRHSGLQGKYLGSDGKETITIVMGIKLVSVDPALFHCKIEPFKEAVN